MHNLFKKKLILQNLKFPSKLIIFFKNWKFFFKNWKFSSKIETQSKILVNLNILLSCNLLKIIITFDWNVWYSQFKNPRKLSIIYKNWIKQLLSNNQNSNLEAINYPSQDYRLLFTKLSTTSHKSINYPHMTMKYPPYETINHPHETIFFACMNFPRNVLISI